MGVNLDSLLAHSLQFDDLMSLPERLNEHNSPDLAGAIHDARIAAQLPVTGEVSWVWSEYNITRTEKEWKEGDSERAALYLHINTPLYSMSLGFEPQLCRVGSGWRWYQFLNGDAIYEAERRIAYQLALILGSPRAIYVNEESEYTAVSYGVSLDQAQQALLERFGPPTTPELAIGPHRIDYVDYMIDDFSDFVSV